MASSNASDPQLAFIRDQVQLCMLPSLKKDLDEVQVLPAHFEAYHFMLKQELPKLYDLLQRNEDVLLNDVLYQEVCPRKYRLFMYLYLKLNYCQFSCVHSLCYCFVN